MPNWCQNLLEIVGPEDAIQEISKTRLVFQEIDPCPQELLDTDSPASEEAAARNLEKYGYKDWWEWKIENWGTKWDAGPLQLDVTEFEGKSVISVFFDSAWSPPVVIVQKLYEKYRGRGVKVRLEYYEPGCKFLGVSKGEGGDFSDECSDYSSADELERLVTDLGCEIAFGEVENLREEEV